MVSHLERGAECLWVFENKVFTKIFFGAKRDKIIGKWKMSHNAELQALYFSPYIIRNLKLRQLRWAGHVVCMEQSKNAYRVLMGRLKAR